MVQYWGSLIGSSDHMQQGDLEARPNPRRYPNLFVHGSFNEYGYDSGLAATMHQGKDGLWEYDFMAEWPTEFQGTYDRPLIAVSMLFSGQSKGL